MGPVEALPKGADGETARGAFAKEFTLIPLLRREQTCRDASAMKPKGTYSIRGRRLLGGMRLSTRFFRRAGRDTTKEAAVSVEERGTNSRGGWGGERSIGSQMGTIRRRKRRVNSARKSCPKRLTLQQPIDPRRTIARMLGGCGKKGSNNNNVVRKRYVQGRGRGRGFCKRRISQRGSLVKKKEKTPLLRWGRQ